MEMKKLEHTPRPNEVTVEHEGLIITVSGAELTAEGLAKAVRKLSDQPIEDWWTTGPVHQQLPLFGAENLGPDF